MNGSNTTPGHWYWRSDETETDPETDVDTVIVDTVIFDIDGVISDASQRQHFLDGEPQDWKGFFAACEHDDVLVDNAKILDLVDPSYQVVLLTARPLWVQDKTLAWLDKHGFRWDLLIMRDHKNPEASAPFKVANARMLQQRGHKIHLVFEDDRRNVAAYQAANIPCVYLHSGYYD